MNGWMLCVWLALLLSFRLGEECHTWETFFLFLWLHLHQHDFLGRNLYYVFTQRLSYIYIYIASGGHGSWLKLQINYSLSSSTNWTVSWSKFTVVHSLQCLNRGRRQIGRRNWSTVSIVNIYFFLVNWSEYASHSAQMVSNKVQINTKRLSYIFYGRIVKNSKFQGLCLATDL